MKTKLLVVFMGILMLIGLNGCNLFSFTAGDEGATDYYEEGLTALRDGDYDGAIDNFTSALEQDPTLVEAYWGRAKAYFRKSGETPITVAAEVSGMETVSASLPFMNAGEWPDERANALYQGVQGANEDLMVLFAGHIDIDGQSYEVSSNLLDSTGVWLDYVSCFAIEGLLTLRDTNGDDVIDNNDINLNALFDMFGTFDFPEDPSGEDWEDLTDEQQNALIDTAINFLENSADTAVQLITTVFPDADPETMPIDLEAIDGNLGTVIDGLNAQRP